MVVELCRAFAHCPELYINNAYIPSNKCADYELILAANSGNALRDRSFHLRSYIKME